MSTEPLNSQGLGFWANGKSGRGWEKPWGDRCLVRNGGGEWRPCGLVRKPPSVSSSASEAAEELPDRGMKDGGGQRAAVTTPESLASLLLSHVPPGVYLLTSISPCKTEPLTAPSEGYWDN